MPANPKPRGVRLTDPPADPPDHAAPGRPAARRRSGRSTAKGGTADTGVSAVAPLTPPSSPRVGETRLADARPYPRPTARADRNQAAQRALADVFRELRTRAGLSQERLADLAQLDRTYLGYLERAKRWPTLESVWYVLRVLGVSWSEFGAALDRHPELRGDPDPRRADR